MVINQLLVHCQVGSSSDSILTLSPPPFPNMLFAFRHSAAASDILQELRLNSDISLASNFSLSCVCRRHLVSNLTQFVTLLDDNNAGGNPDVCSGDDDDPLGLRTESSLGLNSSNKKSGGMTEQELALVIGISAGLIVALSVGAIIVVLSLCFLSRQKRGVPTAEETSLCCVSNGSSAASWSRQHPASEKRLPADDDDDVFVGLRSGNVAAQQRTYV